MRKILAAAAALVLCASASVANAQKLNGAGATFPYPIYSKWFTEYSASHGGLQINYQAIGSGAGIRQVTSGTVDFGASDGPMTDEQIAASKVKIQHIPTVLGAVVPIYNLQGIGGGLKFSPDVLADIYLGKISNWNDGRIAKDNPGVKLPSGEIFVVHRSDGSGTSYIFTDFLSKVSGDWKNGPGTGTSPSWPRGIGAKGNQGVAGIVRQTPGAIGYVELIYALQNKIETGLVRNPAGVFQKATIDSVTAAAASVKQMPADYRVSITNAPGRDAYPISSFTWLLIPNPAPDAAKGKIIKDFLTWMLDHESEATSLDYAPLPASVVSKVKVTISRLK
ncbi:MAG TPA: phosphate ABC transporter substrate-binding protein PstS [Acidobacteriaceae bacterium]|nr:phosphate ABC transporter substrate-binding protein PstS [Acidobacteriaceae bacterium]